MDPDIRFFALLECLELCDVEGAADHVTKLTQQISQGGRKPNKLDSCLVLARVEAGRAEKYEEHKRLLAAEMRRRGGL